MLQKMGKKELELGQDLNLGHAKKSKVESHMTCPRFEPGVCVYPAALTTESSQLLKSRQEMVKDSHKGLTTCPGFEPGCAYILQP